MDNYEYKVQVLLSGGVDSMVLAHYYKMNGYNISCLFINYNQVGSIFEKKASSLVAQDLALPYEVININMNKKFCDGEILGRNMFLISTGLIHSEGKFNVISIGLIKGSHYNDANESFIKKASEIVSLQTNYMTIVQAPLLKMSKKDVYNYIKIHSLRTDITYSCENGIEDGCKNCLSCQDIINYDRIN